MTLVQTTPRPPAADNDALRVMVVDDSAVIRGMTTRILEEDPAIKVVASMNNGQLAVEKLKRDKVDVIVLDIEMPVMDGLTALPLLLEADPDVRIIMSSTLTQRNADISVRALMAGASDYVPKPSSAGGLSADGFRDEITTKVKGIARAARSMRAAIDAARPEPAATPGSQPSMALRQASAKRPEILAIGSSTGGPHALFVFLSHLDKALRVPIVITQHMPPTFIKILAQHIAQRTGWPCKEGTTGEKLEPGSVYLAPGDFHMTVRADKGEHLIALDDGPAENFCRPAVDPMLRSLVETFRERVLTVILTGMGSDGLKGGEAVAAAGGTVLAQDEASSVVWGMPGAVARAGLCAAVLPLPDLSAKVNSFFGAGT